MDLKSLNEEILKTLRNYNSIYDNELISEASKIKILTDKEGLSVEQATFLDEKCGPLAVWMFNKFKDVSNKNHLSLYTKPYQGDELINKINSRN